MINSLLQPLYYLWIYVLICFIVLPASLVALPFSKAKRVTITAPFWNLFFKIILKTVFFSNITKIDRRPLEVQKSISPQGLYVANHKSFTDIPLLFSVLIIPPIMKKEVLYIPLFGICAYSAGGILVDRKDKNSRSKVFEESKQRLLTGRKQLQYYPEGSRQHKNESVLPVNCIKTALMEFAYDKNIPLYPVSMEGTQHTMEKSKIIPFQPLGIILHAPIYPKEFKDKNQFIEKAWNTVITGKAELVAKIYS